MRDRVREKVVPTGAVSATSIMRGAIGFSVDTRLGVIQNGVPIVSRSCASSISGPCSMRFRLHYSPTRNH